MCWKKITIFFVTTAIAVPALFVPTKRAEAFFGCTPTITPPTPLGLFVPVYDAATAVQLSFLNTYQSANFSKECILDALVTMLGQSLINNLTGSIVDWINSDFEGGPAFVTDPAGFFTNIADETAGNFIETQLGPIGQLLCSPFDLRLRLNLWLSTGSSRKQYIGCRLTDIQKNVYGAFTGGSFIASGGWSTFHALTSDPRNNQFGAYILASDALNTELMRKTNEKLRELSEGRGFLSYKKCTEWSEGPNEGTGEGGAKICLKYKVETPGSLINSQLENVFGSELRKFELADEINEVFQALVNYGLRQVFSSAGGGLRGASKVSTGSTLSLTAKLRDPDSFNKLYADAKKEPDTLLRTAAGDIEQTDPTTEDVDNRARGAGASGGQMVPQDRNLALNKTAEQSSTFTRGRPYGPENAVDGIRQGGVVGDNSIYTAAAITDLRTQTNKSFNYWGVTLDKKDSALKEIRIYHRTDISIAEALGKISIVIYNTEGNVVFEKKNIIPTANIVPYTLGIKQENGNRDVVGNRVQILRIDGDWHLQLAEVEVYGTEGATAPAGSEVSVSPGVTLETPPTSTGPIVAPVNQETTTPQAIFAVGEAFSGKVRVLLKKKDTQSGVWKPYAFGQDFSLFTATASGKIPMGNPQQKFAETFVDETVRKDASAAINQPTPYTLVSNLNTSRGTTITISYSFTPDTGARGGQYELMTEFLDSKLQPITGGNYTTTFSVAQ